MKFFFGRHFAIITKGALNVFRRDYPLLVACAVEEVDDESESSTSGGVAKVASVPVTIGRSWETTSSGVVRDGSGTTTLGWG